jgi:hypothetical protein
VSPSIERLELEGRFVFRGSRGRLQSVEGSIRVRREFDDRGRDRTEFKWTVASIEGVQQGSRQSGSFGRSETEEADWEEAAGMADWQQDGRCSRCANPVAAQGGREDDRRAGNPCLVQQRYSAKYRSLQTRQIDRWLMVERWRWPVNSDQGKKEEQGRSSVTESR